jgi:hypothetical protein
MDPVKTGWAGLHAAYGAVRRELRDEQLPRALSGERYEAFTAQTGRFSWYEAGTEHTPHAVPLLLIHSINAAGSAYEVKPIYEQFRLTRPVYAIELPGFGFSERTERRYTPRMMTDALHVLVNHIREVHRGASIDALAVSLSSEYLARAAVENAAAFRTVSFISPTGFEHKTLREGAPESTLAMPVLRALITQRVWRRSLFALLTRRNVIRYFLRRSWGSKAIDWGLLDYDYKVTRPAGSEHAPLEFIAGGLFGADSGRLYRGLTQPVWVARGIRGDFHGYPGLPAVADRPNWTVNVMPTGALPHFELREQFQRDYDRWLLYTAQLRSSRGGMNGAEAAIENLAGPTNANLDSRA